MKVAEVLEDRNETRDLARLEALGFRRKLLPSRKHVESVVSKLNEHEFETKRFALQYCAVAKRREAVADSNDKTIRPRGHNRSSKAPLLKARVPLLEESNAVTIENDTMSCKSCMNLIAFKQKINGIKGGPPWGRR